MEKDQDTGKLNWGEVSQLDDIIINRAVAKYIIGLDYEDNGWLKEAPGYAQHWDCMEDLFKHLRNTMKYCCIKLSSDYNYVWVATFIRADDENHEPCAYANNEESGPKAFAVAALVAEGLTRDMVDKL